jgi:hypothetical protein
MRYSALHCAGKRGTSRANAQCQRRVKLHVVETGHVAPYLDGYYDDYAYGRFLIQQRPSPLGLPRLLMRQPSKRGPHWAAFVCVSVIGLFGSMQEQPLASARPAQAVASAAAVPVSERPVALITRPHAARAARTSAVEDIGPRTQEPDIDPGLRIRGWPIPRDRRP